MDRNRAIGVHAWHLLQYQRCTCVWLAIRQEINGIDVLISKGVLWGMEEWWCISVTNSESVTVHGLIYIAHYMYQVPLFFLTARDTPQLTHEGELLCVFLLVINLTTELRYKQYNVILSNFVSYLQKIDCKVLTSALYLQGIQGTCVAVGSKLWDPLHSLVTILLRGLSEYITPFAAHPRKLDEVEPTKRNRHMHCHAICCNMW